MAFDALKNFAYSTVQTASGVIASSSGTNLIVATGDGVKLPTAPFNITVWPSGTQPTTTNSEIMRVTSISTDTLTVTRNAETGGSALTNIAVGYQVAATITAKTLTDIQNAAQVFVNVKSYGAVGDGVTDDTTAFQNALNASGTASMPVGVYAPAGKYLIAGTLTMSNSQALKGDGPLKTELIKTSAAQSYISITTIGGASVSDMSFNSSTTATSGSVISITTGGTNLNNIRIRAGYTGIEISGSAGGVMCTQIYVDAVVNAAMYLHTCNDVYVEQYIFNVLNTTNCPNGVIQIADKAEAIMFKDGETIFGGQAMKLSATSNTLGNRPAYITFDSAYFDSASNGPTLNNTSIIKFTNCWFSNRGYGITLNTCETTNFQNSQFTNNNTHGLVLATGAVRTTVLGCTFANNSGATTNTYNGVDVAAAVTDFVIDGCTFANSYGFSGSMKYGINIAAGASDRYYITNNLITGMSTGDVNDGGTGANVSVQTSNSFILTGQRARITSNYTNATTTLTNVTGLGFSIGANERWSFEFTLIGTSSTTSGSAFAITVPSGATLQFEATGNTSAATALTTSVVTASGTATATFWTVATTNLCVRIKGMCINGATAGTVQLQGKSLSTNTTTVLANSFFVATKFPN